MNLPVRHMLCVWEKGEKKERLDIANVSPHVTLLLLENIERDHRNAA